MTHLSENAANLGADTNVIYSLSGLKSTSPPPTVHLLWLPSNRRQEEALRSQTTFESVAEFCAGLPASDTVCLLTTPPDAALLLPYLENALKFQLWVAVKTAPGAYPIEQGQLSSRHAALLIMTRYKGTLRHTKTRIGYTYCPACRKTTKDYGGKKHTYHEYGTLMSDVWRDIECNPGNDIDAVIDRLGDVFGLEPYRTLQVYDLRSCRELAPQSSASLAHERGLSLEWKEPAVPIGSQLLNMDCLEALRSLPDNSVDFCFTDPPYNIQKNYDKWDDGLDLIKYFVWCDQWLTELFRVLKPGRTLAVLNIPQWAVRHYQHLSTFMDFQCWIAWEGLSLPVRMIMPAHYAIVCFSKGVPRAVPGLTVNAQQEAKYLQPLAESYCLRASCIQQRQKTAASDRGELTDLWSDIHRLKHNSRRVDHPCQLPPLLMQRLYALFTEPDEAVLDCFNGAGTSTLIAQQMGRKFIGIELSPEYHRLAQSRHEQLARGEDPFGKIDAVPKAKNSRVKRVNKQRYEVSKKVLQLDVKRIAQELGRLPNREEVSQLSPYPIQYFNDYFLSWGEVCAAARTTGMSDLPQDHEERETPQLQLALL